MMGTGQPPVDAEGDSLINGSSRHLTNLGKHLFGPFIFQQNIPIWQRVYNYNV